jgi:cyclase
MGGTTLWDTGAVSTVAPPFTVEVADGVFGYVQPDGSWWINNTGFVVGDDGVCAVDASSTERRTRAFRDAIASVTSLPVDTLVNTHHHGDHTNGNCLFSGAVIVGHVNCRANMADQRIGGLEGVFEPVEWGDLTVAPPDRTLEDRLDLTLGSRRVELRYTGTPAHTTGDVVVWLPDCGVLFAGDLLFNGGTPFVLMGSVAGSLESLQVLRRLQPATIVPGHGGVAGPELIDPVEEYLIWVQDLAREGREAGLEPLDVALQTDLGPWADLLDSERLVGNLHRAYAELEGGPLGRPIDIAAAFADMIAFNGGAPLRCLA